MKSINEQLDEVECAAKNGFVIGAILMLIKIIRNIIKEPWPHYTTTN